MMSFTQVRDTLYFSVQKFYEELKIIYLLTLRMDKMKIMKH